MNSTELHTCLCVLQTLRLTTQEMKGEIIALKGDVEKCQEMLSEVKTELSTHREHIEEIQKNFNRIVENSMTYLHLQKEM